MRVRFNWIKDALAGVTPKNNSFMIVRFIRFRLFIVSLRPIQRGICVLLLVILHGVASYAKCQTRCTYVRYTRYNKHSVE